MKDTASCQTPWRRVALAACVFLLTSALLQAAEPRLGTRVADLDSTCVTFVESMANRLLKFQLADGAISYHAPREAEPLRIVPYFSNMAALGWLEAARTVPASPQRERWLAATRNWMSWYAGHMNTDGSIDDFRGPAGSLKATGSFDSTDSYAATFGLLACRYLEITADIDTIRTLAPALKQAHAAIQLTRDQDGLTYATPLYGFKYLMDNCEVAIGLAAMQRTFTALGDEPEASACAAHLDQIRSAFSLFFCPAAGVFGYAMDAYPLPLCSFKEPYPDAMANLMLLTWLSSGDAPAVALFDRLWSEFWLKNLDSRGFPLWWIWAAEVCGRDAAAVQALGVLQKMTSDPDPDCVLIGMAAVATASGVDLLRFPELRMDWNQLTTITPPQAITIESAWPVGTRAILTGHKLKSAHSHDGQWNAPWTGTFEFPYEFTADAAYAQINLVFPGIADLSSCKGLLIHARNSTQSDIPRALEVALIEADGDIWITSASAALQTASETDIPFSGVKLSPWSKSGNGKPDLSHVLGVRLTLASEDKSGAGVLTIKELRMTR